MTVKPGALGTLIAAIVLVLCIVLAVVHHGPSTLTLGLIAALAVARLTDVYRPTP